MLKKLFVSLIALLAVMSFSTPAYADVAAGAKIFSANCAACHAGGRNAVNPPKTLKQAALAQYGMDSAAAIITQVTKGKGAMPAFAAKLDAGQIESVAAYVLDQAERGWVK